jgi:hypothetical protein
MTSFRTRILLSVVGASTFAAGCADAAARGGSDRWLLVARDTNYSIAIDTTRITGRYARTYTVWYRTDHTIPRLYKDKEFNREIVQGVLQCEDMSFKIASVDMSMGARSPVVQQRAEAGELGQQPWRHVARETIEGRVAQATCDYAGRYATHRR